MGFIRVIKIRIIAVYAIFNFPFYTLVCNFIFKVYLLTAL